MSLAASSEALQAVERLYLQVKNEKDTITDTVFQKCIDTLENLRSIKAYLEGTEVEVMAPEVADANLHELRHLTLMHVPASLTDAVRSKFKDLILRALQDEEDEVLYAVLMTCPWYCCTQQERGESAKHNHIFVVYQSTIDRFFAPVNSHLIDQSSVIDKDWFHAVELFHFVQALAKGKTRNVEALYCPEEAVLYQSDMWAGLREKLHYSKVMGMRSFLEACRGQSIGGIGKKGKDGKFRMKDSTTYRELCDSFRLMHHAYNSLKGLPPCTSDFVGLEHTPAVAMKAVELLRLMYQNPDISKKDCFDLLCEWRTEVESLSSSTYVMPEEVSSILGQWHMQLRLTSRSLTSLQCLPADDHTKLLMLMEKIGGPVCNILPEEILMITQAGSFMYGLNTPTSDTDYVVIYAEKTEKILTSCKRLSEIMENRGPQKQIEYGAYEVRCFAEMLLKGSVVMLELVYKDDHNYMSPAWKALSSRREMFVTETAIQQYMGLVKNNFRMVQNGKHKDAPQERKLFYQIYHKMDSLSYLLQGVPPPVVCSGPLREFIMLIRKAPLEGDLHRDLLYKDALAKFSKLRCDQANRKTRLLENCDFDFLVDWILTVRGIH